MLHPMQRLCAFQALVCPVLLAGPGTGPPCWDGHVHLPLRGSPCYSSSALTEIYSPFVLVSCDCRKKLPQTAGLKQQKFILFRFWRWYKIQNQAVDRTVLSPSPQGEESFLNSCRFWWHQATLAYSCATPVSAPAFSSSSLHLLLDLLDLGFTQTVWDDLSSGFLS